jgi:hypothetical protein
MPGLRPPASKVFQAGEGNLSMRQRDFDDDDNETGGTISWVRLHDEY